MRRHARAVILLGGWLLIAPPLVEDRNGEPTGGVRSNAPTREWSQVSAHDTAKECEAAKWDTATHLIDLSKKAKAEGSKSPLGEALVTSAMRSLCVPAEHIYPPKKPAQK